MSASNQLEFPCDLTIGSIDGSCYDQVAEKPTKWWNKKQIFSIAFSVFINFCLLSKGYCIEKEPPRISKQVTLKILDKETGKVATFTTPISTPVRYKSLIVRPRACIKRKAGLAHEVKWSFIEAWIQSPVNFITTNTDENKPDSPSVHLIFSSWLNSALPGFFHPNYSILIQDCNEVKLP